MKSFKDYCKEEAPTNAVGTDSGIDLNPTGKNKKPFYKKMDRRSRWNISKLYKKSKGS
jgi:hypothetical protein